MTLRPEPRVRLIFGAAVSEAMMRPDPRSASLARFAWDARAGRVELHGALRRSRWQISAAPPAPPNTIGYNITI